jgi:PAS domain S-box-containing protein
MTGMREVMHESNRGAPPAPFVGRELRALIVEDSELDFELLLLELHRLGFEVQCQRVEAAEEMVRALEEGQWQIVFSDYSLPRFSAPEALGVLQRSGLDLPFIIISGTIGEDVAVDSMRAGAHDFLLKNRLARLLPVVERELLDAETRRARRRMEEELRANEARYRTIVETAQEGIWLLDLAGKTQYANRRLTELLGLSPEALRDLTFADLVAPEFLNDANRLLSGLGQGLAGRCDLQFRRSEGEPFWASVGAGPIRNSRGQTEALVAMVTDLTESRSLQVQLISADRMASTGLLAAGVAHDLKNALAGVIANLELAARDAEEVEGPSGAAAASKLREEIADAKEGAERVHEIAQDLNVLSRPANERVVAIDLLPAVDSAARIIGARIRERARFVRELSDVPFVRANESQLVQVFLNLLVNAEQALPESPASEQEVGIRTSTTSQGDALVEIWDTGSGMSDDTLSRLFTPFFTTKPAGLGTGLGLSICRRIVESFGGEIWPASMKGEGSRFFVRLPAAAEAPVAKVMPKVALLEESRRGSILLVDDDESVRTVVSRILGPVHELTTAANGAEALRLIKNVASPFDLILCDLEMPRMSGLELYAAVRELSLGLAERIVFLSGGIGGARIEAHLATLPNSNLEKPFHVSELRELVARELSRHRGDG